jgi:hypothetical protein
VLWALRRLKRDQEPPSPFVFTSERSAPFTTAGRRKMVARLGVAAKLGFKAHPHAPMQVGVGRAERLYKASGWYARVTKRIIKGRALCLTTIALCFTVPWKA